MNPKIIAFFMAVSALLCGPGYAQSTISSDFAEITGTTASQAVSGWGSPGSVARHGKSAFPILMDGDGVSMMAAGRYNDGTAVTTARAIAFAHNGPLSGGGDSMPALLESSVKWASRKTTPSTITVGCGSGIATAFWTSRGYLTKSVTTSMSSSSNDLSGVDVFIFDWHSGYSASAVSKIQAFTAAGGGIVCGATPWALGSTQLADSSTVLLPFGLTYSGSGWDGPSPATVPSTAPSAYYSALNGSSDLIRDKEGQITLTLADKVIIAGSIDQVLAVRKDLAALNSDLNVLSDTTHYGWITPTAAAPIAKASKPVEAMLARYQSNQFDAMTPAQLFAHPCANDFPGAPAAGSTVSRTVSINGNTSPDGYMNQGSKPVRVETGVYAAPGSTITITIPANKVSNGLQAHIAPNGSEDQTWGISNWTFFPKLWRRVPLTATTTQTGSVFGGLVTILVPAGSNLGTFDVTVSGALAAPTFVMGQNTNAEWNATLKNNPAPYGFLQTDKITLYVAKTQLVQMDNPEAVAQYWKAVMDTADEYYGYTPWRKRREAIASARYVAAGAAYAGYPIEAGWGVSEDEFLGHARASGSWGNYHELGHGFQDNFDGAFVIPTHAEVDVNLFPGMIYTLVHDRTAWDGPTHSTYDASNRITDRASFLALAAASQTWEEACGRTTGYDFYFNLSEAFGWQAYKTMLGRLMNYLQNPSASTDTQLKSLSSGDANFKRNRFYLLMCDATGRNLDTYFQRYGLGVTGRGYEITQSVKDLVAAKNYPVWTDNTAIDTLSNPGTLNIDEATAPGAEIYQFTATDADEPGTIWDYSITAGNTNNAFSIDRRTGKLRAQQLDADTTSSYNLTVTVQDNGVPRFSKTATFTVNVANLTEAPKVDGKLFTATGAMANGTSLGTLTATLETGRSVTSYEIVAGNDGHFAVTAAGALTVTNASTLPNPGVIGLTVKLTDSTGQVGYGTVSVLCNTTTGIYEERWATKQMIGSPSVTAIRSSFNMPTNVGSNFVRRVSGWVIPPKTGSYTFWIASDDGGQLDLSPDHTSAKRESIAIVSGSTTAVQWTKYPTQQSKAIFLEAGKPYYIEAIHYEGSGNDNLAVAWSGPGISQQIIPGTNLIPNTSNITVAVPVSQEPTVSMTAPLNQAVVSMSGTTNLAAQVTANLNGVSKVEFFDGETSLGADFATPYELSWSPATPGAHILKARVHYQDGVVDSAPVNVQAVLAGPPVVTITSPNVASTSIPSGVGLVLEATVLDDTPASIMTSWSKVSGPGNVVFGDGAAINTTANFSADGAYVLRLTANDGVNQTSKDLSIVVKTPTVSFTNADIGGTGSGSFSNGAFTVQGTGNDIYGTSDECHYYYASVTGDFDVSVRMASKSISSTGAHGALMARASLATNSMHVSLSQEGNNTYLMQRSTTGGSTTINIGNRVTDTVPTWYRLVRSGTNFTGYISTDGSTWVQKGPVTSTMPTTILLGFAVSNSNTGGTANVVVFDNLTGMNVGIENIGASVNAGSDQAFAAPAQATLVGTAVDDGRPSSPGTLTTTWSKFSGPGNVTFGNANALSTFATFSAPGSYVLRLTAADGEVKTFDDVIVANGPTVTIVATDASAAEQGGETGTFTVSRTGVTTSPLTVNLNRSGIATNGVDYQTLPASVTIPTGAASATLTVSPIADSLSEGDETVTVGILADTLYAAGSPSSASVIIADIPVDSWRKAQFGSDANNSALAGDSADYDGDGLRNLAEYALSLNPKGFNTPLIHGVEGGMLTLTYTRNLAATDVTLTPRWSVDFTSWSNSEITEEILGEIGTIRTIKAKVPIDTDTRKFLRLQITRP